MINLRVSSRLQVDVLEIMWRICDKRTMRASYSGTKL